MNHLLVTYFKHPESAKAFSRLEMSNPKTGKLAFVSACNLLPKEMRTFIESLSEMRNFIVHDIKNFGFSFHSHMESKDLKDRKAWLRHISYVFPSNLPFGEREITAIVFAELDPRFAVHWGCITVARYIFNHHSLSKAENETLFALYEIGRLELEKKGVIKTGISIAKVFEYSRQSLGHLP